jgi:hypothetical protein
MSEALQFIEGAQLVLSELIAADLEFRRRVEQRMWRGDREWLTITNLQAELRFVATVDSDQRMRLVPRRGDEDPLGLAELQLRVGVIPSAEPSTLNIDRPRLFGRAMPFFTRVGDDRFALSTNAGTFAIAVRDNRDRDVKIKRGDDGMFVKGWPVSWLVAIFTTLGRWLGQEDEDPSRIPFSAARAEHALLRMLGDELTALVRSFSGHGLAQIDPAQFDALGPIARRLGQYYQLSDLHVTLGLRLDGDGRPLTRAGQSGQLLELQLSLQPSTSGQTLLLERSFAGLVMGERKAAAVEALRDAADALGRALELTAEAFVSVLDQTIDDGLFIARYDLDDPRHLVLISGVLETRPIFGLFELQLREGQQSTVVDSTQIVVLARRFGDRVRNWDRMIWPKLGHDADDRLHVYTSLLLRTLESWA